MVISPLSFSATENLRKKLMAMNLEPYFVNGSTSPKTNKQDVGTKETQWIELPLVNQQDLDKSGLFPQVKLNVLNQYGPENGRGPEAIFKNLGTKTNEGEFNFQTNETNKFVESEQEQKELLVLNRFAPQQGWTDSASEFELEIVQPTIRDEYVSDSTKPNLFRPSSYSSAQIYIEDNPTGSDGTLSEDSALAQIAARRLKQLFIDSVAYEIQQETVGRANGVIAARDPYLASKILTGRSPLIEPNWNISTQSSALGKAADFVARITGVYSPFSYIPGDYFSPVQPTSLLNQVINAAANIFGLPRQLPTRKTASDVFLAYTGQGTRKLLFGSLGLNKYAPDYRANFANQLGLSAPKGNYYIGSRNSEPLDIVSPPGEIPVDEYGTEIQTNVYGPSLMGSLYENDLNFKFGLNLTPTIEGGGLQGGFTWVSPKYKGNAGFLVGKGGDPKQQDPNFQPIAAQFNDSQSTQFSFRKGSILDDTQRLINSQPSGGKKLQHVGNAIDQVSKVFNDGYKEITKGSRVIRYTDQNGVFVGSEYGRVFAKDIPYYENTKLLKSDGNIRKEPFSILDKTYNLNMYPTTGPDSTSIVDGRVKKYMLSIENLAWRTSRRPGLTYADLPESEKGPNGGRIMWFPPYDVSFSDDSTVSWDENQFLGRPESIYTYKGTSRGGSLGFKMIVDHPSVMNLVVNQVLSNTNSAQVADKVLESFFAGLTKFDVYELGKRYQNFSTTQLQDLQNVINKSSNPEKIKDAINSNLNKGGDGAGGSMTSNSSYGIQDYKPQLTAYISSEYYFDYRQSGGDSYNESLNGYKSNPQFSTIQDVQRINVENSISVLQDLAEKIKEIFTTNPNVKINVILKSNISGDESPTLRTDRNECIATTLTTLIGNSPNLTITKENGDTAEVISNYPCNSATTENYAVGPVACRRVVIKNIIETPSPNINNPNGGVTQSPSTVVGNIGSQAALTSQLNRAATNSSSNLQETIGKDVLRKLLNESNYFQFIKETNPYVYDSLREKLKYFHPAFHSSTPEGLNSRLTFLLQCTRPGDTIPTKQADGTFLDKDARNTAFGAPPICVIRIGDFYHTKAVIDSVRFSYDDAKFDLNPEGIGVQPMIANVTIGFKFIGGQSLRGPVEELQNALSFNFFANTEMYDERATVLDLSAYNKEFIEATEPTGDTTENTNTDLSSEAGTFIGKLNGQLQIQNSKGDISYQNIMEDLIGGYENLYTGIKDKFSEINAQYNWLIFQTYNSQRIYGDGKLYTGSTPTSDIKIFGKSQNYKQRIESIFDDVLSDIQNGQLSLFTQPSFPKGGPENDRYTQILKKNLTDLVNQKRATFLEKLDTITKQLSDSQLPYVRAIDKINYLSNKVDGKNDTTGNVQLYDITGTTTMAELVSDSKLITSASTKIIDEYVKLNLIKEQKEYDFSSITYFNITQLNNVSDRKFVAIMAFDLITNLSEIRTRVTGELNIKPWEKLIKDYLDNLQKGAQELSKNAGKELDKFDKTYSKASKVLPPDWNKIRKKDREDVIFIQTTPNSDLVTKFRQLYSGVNSTDNTFNLKFTF